MHPGTTYHFFNHANGNEKLFAEEKNYAFFLEKLAKYILPVCRIYSYCLMPNHFHLVAGVRSIEELSDYFSKKNAHELSPVTGNKKASDEHSIKKVSKSFSNMFNSYTQAYNKVYNRMGSLFMQNMKKQEINDDNSFCKVIHYTHVNPVHHKFVKCIDDWEHSSYKLFLSNHATKIERDFVLQKFGGLNWFIKYHNQPIEVKNKFLE